MRRLTMQARPTPRAGFALAGALAALVIVAVLAAGLLFVAGQEQRAAGQTLAGERALAAAELALAGAPSLWEGIAASSIAVGDARERALALSGGDSATVRLTRFTTRTAWAHARGESGGARSRARRGVSMLFTLGVGADSSAVLVPVTQRAWVQTF